MVPQSRQLKTQCSSISARTPAQLSQAAPLERDQNAQASDDVITSPGSEHDGQRLATASSTPLQRPHDASGLVSVGPRPLILGTFKVASPSPTTSFKSRLSTPSSTLVPRTPKLPSTRWSSYTLPFSPHSPPSPSPVSAEVETLKAQLAASEALVELLTKEKFEAIFASRRLFRDIQILQEQQIEWEKEKEDLTAELISRQEDKATPVVSPPSEGVWFAGSSEERRSLPKEHPSHLPPTHLSQHDGNLKTPPAEELPIPRIIVSPPTDSDGRPEPEAKKSSKRSPGTSTGRETTIVSLPPTSYLSPPPTRRARRSSCRRGKAIGSVPIIQHATPPSSISPWASTPSRRALLDALGLPSLPVAPQPTSSVSASPPVFPPQLDLNDLVSQTVGKDIRPGSLGRQVLHNRSKLPGVHGDGPAGRSPSTSPATGLELQASMIHAPSSNRRPRNAPSESPNWMASHERETQLDHLRRFASETATVESRGRRPSALKTFTPSSSLREEAGDMKPQKISRLRKLLNKGRSVISRII